MTKKIFVTDTILRDAHQSLLATIFNPNHIPVLAQID